MNVERLLLSDDLKGQEDLIDLAPLLIEGEAFIAGGVFKDIFIDNVPKDIDVFFYNVGGYNNAVERFRNSQKYVTEYSTPRSMGFKHTTSNMIVDLVCYQFGTPVEVISRFDFSVCKMAFYKEDGHFYVVRDAQFLTDLENRKLSVENEIENPDLFFNRMLRYIDYGFKVDIVTKQRLFEAIQNATNLMISPINKKY